jgi:hypothetical protein
MWPLEGRPFGALWSKGVWVTKLWLTVVGVVTTNIGIFVDLGLKLERTSQEKKE